MSTYRSGIRHAGFRISLLALAVSAGSAWAEDPLVMEHVEVIGQAVSIDKALREQRTPVEYLAALLEAEMAERAERRERRRLIDARVPVIKRLEDFRYEDNPNVSPAVIARAEKAVAKN